MWAYLAIIVALMLIAAGIFSPFVWFLVPAVVLLALALTGVLGGVGRSQESLSKAEKTPALSGDGEEAEPSRAAHAETGYAHTGQQPGH